MTSFLGLGSNQGDRLRHLQAAVERLHGHDPLRVVAVQSLHGGLQVTQAVALVGAET